MRYPVLLLSALLLIHGLIHVLGFGKAFGFLNAARLTQTVPKAAGIPWLVTMILFLAAGCFLLFGSRAWWLPAVPALLISQGLIIQSWTDARFGTIANVIIAVPVFVAFMGALPSSFESRYKGEVERRLKHLAAGRVVTADDITRLPLPVQRYLIYAGVVGKPGVRNFRAEFRGSFKRSEKSGWMSISARQYEFYDEPARVFYIKSALFGIPFDGLHLYVRDHASMEIKVANIFKAADAKGEKMTRGETVTLFNDMCLMAPSTLLDSSVVWKSLDSLTAEASFTNNGTTIGAVLSFNGKGELVDFVSNDRYLSADGKTYTSYPWSTPAGSYREIAGRKIPTHVETVWHKPDGDFSYGKFDLVAIEYDCEKDD